MSNLMELIDECTPLELNGEKIEAAAQKARQLNELGFSNAAGMVLSRVNKIAPALKVVPHKFVCVTPDKIRRFLVRKATAYNAKSDSRFENVSVSDYLDQVRKSGWAVHNQHGSVPEAYYEIPTVDISRTAPGTIGRFAWREELIRNYDGVPPEPVLAKLAEVKKLNLFDEFTVATVETVHDPLLLGYMKGNDNRWFIAQWGDDVCLDDVI